MAVRYSGNHLPRGSRQSTHFSISALPDLPPEPDTTQESSHIRRSEGLSSIIGALSERLADRDTLLTAVLLLLLLREGGDKRLILALAYIMM